MEIIIKTCKSFQRGFMGIARNLYLNKIISCANNGRIKVITGIRRCGKSYLLFNIYKNYLLTSGVKEEQIIALSLDQTLFAKYRNPLLISEYIHSLIDKKNEQFYLFIDEIQMARECINPYDPKGDKLTIYDLLNDLKNIPNLDVYVTGSNSKMLSSDIRTEFRGRSDEIRIRPLSFKEYYDYIGGDKLAAFNNYVCYGGMPEVINKGDDSSKMEYLSNLFNETYIKDIVEHQNIKRVEIMNCIIDLLSSSIGSLTNPLNITNSINSKMKLSSTNIVSNTTITNYISYLEDAFMFNEAKRFDVKGKDYLDSPLKYYCIDVGLRNARTGFRQIEMTHIMENIIYNELLIRGYNVDVGVVYTNEKNKNGNYVKKAKEIDFICKKGNKQCYIQSAYAIEDDKKRAQEISPYKKIGDSFKKIIITGDTSPMYYNDDGILFINIFDFLLNTKDIDM